MACVSIGGVSLKSLINHSLDEFWSHVVWVGVVNRGILSSSGRRCHDLSRLQKTKCEVIIMTEYNNVQMRQQHQRAVAVLDVPGYESRVHTHDYDGSEAPDGSPDSILSSEPKPLGKHRPPPPPSILSPRESSYPP
ncbi:hypothetical protein Tco_0410911 [Tanacetum coccineum]